MSDLSELGSMYASVGTQRVDAAVNNASDVEQDGFKAVEVPGRYVMEVQTFCAKSKSGDVMSSPKFKVTEKSAAIVSISLRVANSCGTALVPEGSTVWTNLVLYPTKEKAATPDGLEQTLKMLKPRLVALLGHNDIHMTDMPWVESNMIAEFAENADGTYTVSRDHKMKCKVYVTIESEYRNNKLSMNVKSLSALKAGDVSVSIPDGAVTNNPNDHIPFDIPPPIDTTTSAQAQAASELGVTMTSNIETVENF